MAISNFAGTAISNTYQRVVQTDGLYLGDGTGSLINNLALPGNLYVSGTLYANNSVVITESYYSGSNQFGNDQNDTQLLYGTVRIPTGSLTVSGALQISSSQPSYFVGGGNVGIGTTSPTKRLEIHDSGSGDGLAVVRTGAQQRIEIIPNDSTFSTLIRGGGNNKPFYIAQMAYFGAAQPLYFGTGYTSGLNEVRMTIDAVGKVGISTMTPSASLHISGSPTDTLLQIDSPNSSSIINISGSGNLGFGQVATVNAQATFKGKNSYTTEINTITNGSYGVRTDGPVKAGGFYFGNSSGNIASYTGVSILYFDTSNNVGLNISSSLQSKFHIRGAGTTSSTTAFRIENAGATASLVVKDDGYVGIGTAFPNSQLEIVTGANAIRFGGANGRILAAYTSGSLSNFDFYAVQTYFNSDFLIETGKKISTSNGSTGNLYLTTSDITKSIYTDRSVGIGATSSLYTLNVSGSGRFTSGVIVTGSLSVSGSQNYNGDVNINGTLTATVKSFLINHPTQPGKKLQYGNLEGPEHGVYFRGKSTSNIIELPEEWIGLVDEETITVQLTSIGKHQSLYVEEIKDNKIFIGVSGWIISQPQLNYFYLIHGERKDVNKLITTIN